MLLLPMWYLAGVGVAMCTDAGTTAQCETVTAWWGFSGLTLAVTALCALALFLTAARPGILQQVATWCTALSTLGTIVVITVFIGTVAKVT
ncbi:hypothetical protein ACIPY5_08370 [Microbacterium sp. NPDC089698]|uniref:hypothetical protein n=1 Tax=Microbacterium sp. NPDC089698 TaxID=3364200 RepID=UPI00381F0147